MPSLPEIAAFLDEQLRVRDYAGDRNGILKGSDAPIRRLGLALEPGPGLPEWISSHAPDALIFHRAWSLDMGSLPPAVGVLAYHLPFDEHLTLGFNPRLAAAIGLTELEVLGRREERAIGMLGRIGPTRFATIEEHVLLEFGGVEVVVPPREPRSTRIAVVGAMTDALVREAAARGAGAYLTGQLRAPARGAVAETGIGVIAIGHRRSERWGLRALQGLLRGRWPGLEIFLEEDPPG